MRKSSKTQDASRSRARLRVSVFWGDLLYDTAICEPNGTVTVGRDSGNTFILDLPSSKFGGSFRLVQLNPGDSAEFFFDEQLSGHLRFGNELLSLAAAKVSTRVVKEPEGFYRATLSRDDKADVVIGHVSFYLDWLEDGRALVLPRGHAMDRGQLALFLTLGLLSLFTIAYLQLATVPEPEKPPERLVTILPRAVPAKAAIGAAQTADGGAQGGALGKASLAPPAEKPSAASEVRKANLGSMISGLTSFGSRAPSVPGAKEVSAAISQVGTGGFSTEGLKAGGGGKSVGIGRTVGQGEGGFEGTGRLGLAGDAAIEGGTGRGVDESVERGGLDRGVIDAIIRRRQDRIRLCYERQLNFNPKLSGKVAVHFVIGKAGNVLSSRIIEDTMRNDSVDACILSEVRSWTFPPPQGGTLVNVDYPFVFESGTRGSG